MMGDQFLPQVPAGMGENVIHIHQYNNNCSFNSYQMPTQPFMAPSNISQVGPMMCQQQMPQAPFYPCFPAQQQLPRWTPTAP